MTNIQKKLMNYLLHEVSIDKWTLHDESENTSFYEYNLPSAKLELIQQIGSFGQKSYMLIGTNTITGETFKMPHSGFIKELWTCINSNNLHKNFFDNVLESIMD